MSTATTPPAGFASRTSVCSGTNVAANTPVSLYWEIPAPGTLVGAGTTDLSGNLSTGISLTGPPGAWATSNYPVTVVDDLSRYPVNQTYGMTRSVALPPVSIGGMAPPDEGHTRVT